MLLKTTGLISEEIHTEKGVFGAFMDVKLNNYGPVTIIVEKEFKD